MILFTCRLLKKMIEMNFLDRNRFRLRKLMVASR